ncbi:MAG: DUF4292 domain-containing protein [Clostridium sp.]|nr:DUF4292 domain-containing protein [Clostridium sp.]
MNDIWGAVRGLSLVLLLTLAACRSSKTVVGTVPAGTPGHVVEQLITDEAATRQKVEAVTAKVSVEAEADGRKMSVGGSLKMKRDDVIQLSLVALGFVEAGRLELTPDYLLLIDRLGKRYVKVPYADVTFLNEAGITFDSFQALFWNELFVPGKKRNFSAADFALTETRTGLELQARTDSRVACRFVIDMAQALLRQSVVSDARNTPGPALRWDYDRFEDTPVGRFPRQMDIAVDGLGKTFRLGLGLGNIKADDKWETRTAVPSKKYKEVNLSTILKTLKLK